MTQIRLKRVYDAPAAEDGERVLVERLWPRGVAKDHAKIDLWLKEVGPTTELRKWFSHDVAKWPEFQKRYRAELKQNPAFAELKAVVAKNRSTTFIFSSHDAEHNNAVVLRSLCLET